MMKPTLNILVFGEILFDVFEQDARLGGAPLNLAVHLHRLGAETTLISAVGQDRPGDDAIRKIADEGIDTGRIARVSHPTGRVNVTLDKAKIPSYCFLPECAWDFIPVPSDIPVTPDLFCFGTLAQRGEEFKEQVQQILGQKQQELTDPIIKKATEALKAVGTEKGFTYIFDLSQTPIPFINEQQSTDVTADVKAKLGIQ